MPANTSSFRVRLNRSLTAPASCAKMRWRMRRLKSGEGSELEVSGPGLAAALIQARLVDEIGVYISPMAVGGGKHFFATLEGPLELSVPGLQTFEGDVVHLRYAMQAQPRALGRARLVWN